MKNLMFKVSVVCSFPIVTAGIRLYLYLYVTYVPIIKVKMKLRKYMLEFD